MPLLVQALGVLCILIAIVTAVSPDLGPDKESPANASATMQRLALAWMIFSFGIAQAGFSQTLPGTVIGRFLFSALVGSLSLLAVACFKAKGTTAVKLLGGLALIANAMAMALLATAPAQAPL